MNNKQALRKLIREMLDNWEPESSYVETIDAMSPAEVASILKDAIGGRHASGRKYHSAFLKGGMNESAEDWPTAEEIENFLRDYKDDFEVSPARNYWKYNTDDSENISYVAQQIIGSIFLFTGAHVPTVRDPNKYNPQKAHGYAGKKYFLPADKSIESEEDKNAKGQRAVQKIPSFFNYKMANHVMKILASRKSGNVYEAYRGIKVPNDPAFLEGLKPGVEFECWPISSFTVRYDTANRFSAIDPGQANDVGKCGIVIAIKKLSTGTYIDPYSYYPDEFEIVSSPKLVIKRFVREHGPGPNKSHWLECVEV